MKNNCLILGVVPDKWYGKGDKKNCNLNEILNKLEKEDVIKLLEILFTARKDSLNKCLLEPITFELLKELYFPTIR